jgi:ribA/ribD-fused uncharacterized protein
MATIYFYSTKSNYFWLSNFYYSPFILKNRKWPTVEHYFQAMKVENYQEQERIRLLPTPIEAKRAGRRVPLRPDWEQIKDSIMEEALFAKFQQSPVLKRKLLATREAHLHEDSPYDKYWGVKGKDRLGALLMEVREKLKNGG